MTFSKSLTESLTGRKAPLHPRTSWRYINDFNYLLTSLLTNSALDYVDTEIHEVRISFSHQTLCWYFRFGRCEFIVHCKT